MNHLTILQQLADIPEVVELSNAVRTAAGKSFNLTHAFDLWHQQAKLETGMALECLNGVIAASVRLHTPWTVAQLLTDRSLVESSMVALLQFCHLPHGLIGGSGVCFPGSITFDTSPELVPQGHITSITVRVGARAR